jgi:hypothetical protein
MIEHFRRIVTDDYDQIGNPETVEYSNLYSGRWRLLKYHQIIAVCV